VQIPVIFALASWRVTLSFMLGCVKFAQRLAIAVRLSVKSTTMIIANAVLKLAVNVLNLAARWQQQWRNN